VSEYLIECEDLGKRYGSTRALDSVTLQLEAGQPIALIGPNGAGKTTLMSLICGFIRPSSGVVRVFGARPGSRTALRKLSALPQDASMDPAFTIERQLRHYADLQNLDRIDSRNEPGRVLELVQLGDRAKSKASQLSHGMRKRVMIAQALIGSPELVLLDEPTAGIDPPNVKIIRELIANQADSATFIISSHNLDELEKVCTSVIHLANGQLQGVKSIDESDNDGFLTISLRQSDGSADPMPILQTLQGAINVTRRSALDFTIEYNRQSDPDCDIRLLQLLAERGIGYRRLIRGRSLEDQLFS